MNTLSIDGVDYKISDLSSEILAQVAVVQKVDEELQALNFSLQMLNAARSAYAVALNAALPKTQQ